MYLQYLQLQLHFKVPSKNAKTKLLLNMLNAQTKTDL